MNYFEGGLTVITTRDCVREYLLAGVFNTVTGYNDKTVQFQGVENGQKVFGCYNTDGNWEKEMFDIEDALDYIGLGGDGNDTDGKAR